MLLSFKLLKKCYRTHLLFCSSICDPNDPQVGGSEINLRVNLAS